MKLMTQMHSNRTSYQGRLFPELTISAEEKAKRQAEIDAFYLQE